MLVAGWVDLFIRGDWKKIIDQPIVINIAVLFTLSVAALAVGHWIAKDQ